MLVKDMVQVYMEAFKENIQDICDMRVEFDDLSPAILSEITSAFKKAAGAGGQAMLKRFFESLDVDAPKLIKDGQEYLRKMVSSRPFLTAFGEVEVSRTLYQRRDGGQCLIPIDAKLAMTDDYATPDVRDAVLYTAVHNTPREVESILAKCALFTPGATAIVNMLNKTGRAIYERERELAENISSKRKISDSAEVVAVSLDGATVRLKGRIKDENDTHSTHYKNAMVGTISHYGAATENDKGQLERERFETTYIGRMPEEGASTLKKHLEDELERQYDQLSGNVVKMLICDGARSLWSYADGTSLFDDHVKVLDFYHASEHLHEAAEALFGKGFKAASEWYRKWYDKLLESDGGVDGVIRSIEYYLKRKKLSKKRRTIAESQRNYFLNNKIRMNYAELLRRGLPIGSGVVEAACKTIVKTRMCRCGMSWKKASGQSVMTLRCYAKSEIWDLFWETCCEMRVKEEAEFKIAA